MLNIIGQVVGIVAMIISPISYQMKTYKSIMIVMTTASSLFCIHYLLLMLVGNADILTAFALQVLLVLRDIGCIIFEKDLHKKHIVEVVTIVLMAGFGVATWTGILSLVIIIARITSTLSVCMSKPQHVRLMMLISAPISAVYNGINGSIGGTIADINAAISAAVGLIRYRKKSHQENSE